MNLQEALTLRDKHRSRTPEETEALHNFINTAAINHEYAAVFTIMRPFIFNVVSDIKKRYSLYDIEDLVQDSFIVLSEYVDRYNCDGQSFLAFTSSYFSFTLSEHCQRKYRYLYREFTSHFENYIDKRTGTSEDYVLGGIFAKHILKELNKVSSCKGITHSKKFNVYNKTLSHYFVDNLDIYEIADIMQCSYHGVYGRIARYLYYLSQILNKDEFRTVELHNEVKHDTNSSIVYSKVYEFRDL